MSKADRKASIARMQAAREATCRIVETNVCPCCGGGVKRNLSITGWWQCEQFGAMGFRKDPHKAPCNWQGFTE